MCKLGRFPLLYAAMSNCQPMVQLFAEQRPTILRDTDDEGNNILHNLAELSIKHPERAIKCLKIILKTFPRELIRDVLMEAKNFNGLTALEQAVL